VVFYTCGARIRKAKEVKAIASDDKGSIIFIAKVRIDTLQ